MIALDANTALRSFHDATYDMAELAKALERLVGSETTTYLLKYADGSVWPTITAALLHQLVEWFPYLALGEDDPLLLQIADPNLGGLVLSPDGAGLQAYVQGTLLHYEGTGPVPIIGGRIRRLTVRGATSIGDASAALEGKHVAAVDAASVQAQQGFFESANAASFTDSSQFGPTGQDVGELSSQSLAYPASPLGAETLQYVSRPNIVETTAPSTPTFLNMVGSPQGMEFAEAIELNDVNAALRWPTLSGAQRDGECTLTCEVPYAEGGSVRYLPWLHCGVVLKDEVQYTLAPQGFTDLFLWPSWFVRGNNFVTDVVKGLHTALTFNAVQSNSFPIILVKNMTDSPMPGVATAWTFGHYVAGDRELGTVSVRRRVTLPPRCSLEFLFAYDAAKNSAYMFPSRAL